MLNDMGKPLVVVGEMRELVLVSGRDMLSTRGWVEMRTIVVSKGTLGVGEGMKGLGCTCSNTRAMGGRDNSERAMEARRDSGTKRLQEGTNSYTMIASKLKMSYERKRLRARSMRKTERDDTVNQLF